jgi:hypothetical protein
MKKILFICCFLLLAVNQIFADAKFNDQDLQNELKNLAQKTDKIIILYNATKNSPQIELKGKDVKEFFSLLKLKIPAKLYYCRCPGTLVINFFSKNKRLGGVTYHHSISVRASFVPLHSNIDIVKEYREKLKAFLLKHGIKADKLK